MNVSITTPPATADACTADRSCADTGCGCTTTTKITVDTPKRKTFGRAGLIGLLCVLGCAAGPLAIGGLAAATGALSGEAWIIAAGLIVAAAFYLYRRKTGKRNC